MLVADHQSNSVPIQHGKIVPKDELVRSSILKRISKKKIKNIEYVEKVSIFLMSRNLVALRQRHNAYWRIAVSKESEEVEVYMSHSFSDHQSVLTLNIITHQYLGLTS